MRLPGFTAEASLFKTDEPYRLIGAWAGCNAGQAVIPQACILKIPTIPGLPFSGWCLCCSPVTGLCNLFPPGCHGTYGCC